MMITEHGTGLVLDVNQALCRLTGVGREALIGRPIDALPALVDPDRLLTLRRMLARDGAVDSAPLNVRRANGDLRTCLISSEVFMSESTPEVFSIIRDVTDRLRSDEALRDGHATLAESAKEREQAHALTHAQTALARTEEELQNLTSSISHDLRGPLQIIQRFSSMLRADLQAGDLDKVTRHAERIESVARRMDGIVEALARLSGVNRRPLELGPVDMTALAREAWALLQAEDDTPRAVLRISDLPSAMGDGQLLSQVWQNLLANARKYSARTTAPRVGVDSFTEDGRQWYRVTDNGVGFEMNYAKHLFEPFQRLHSATDFPGTGIGLNIVRRILRRHGGEIRARGNVGVGAVFEFTLEARNTAAQAATASASGSPDRPDSGGGET